VPADLLPALALARGGSDQLVDELAALVAQESPSSDLAALAATVEVVAAIGAGCLGTVPERIETEGRTHLRWSFGGDTKVVLIGHLDTVWPIGTTAGWPFQIADGKASGPGAFDMKAGLVQGFHALAALDDREGVVFLITSDEEIGSPTSRPLIEATARGARAALVLEPSATGGALKTARKGVSLYELAITGKEAHAGLEPERGVNALIELAHRVVALEGLARPDLGTTVTPTVASAGTATNTVPATASVQIDVRSSSIDEQTRVDREMRELDVTVPGDRVEVRGGPNRPPLAATSSRALFDRARRLADELGLSPLDGVEVGGGSDGNFTAALGVPTLDGLGAVGDGAHARTEHVQIGAMAERSALVAALVADLLED
jgi:glutamate carboxypeptidase